jgi:lipopolysaccharide transport system ATP-binding protein
MDSYAIRAENLGKLYQVGLAKWRHDTLRDALAAGARTGASRFRSLLLSRAAAGHGDARSQNNFVWALRDVSFEVGHGEVMGVIGRNGAGKSTLFKILSQITEPTTGRVTINGRVGSLLEVGTGFHPELTGRENIYLNGAILGMRKREIERKFDEIVAFAEIDKFLDTPVKRYSSGMYVRLAFAVAAHMEPEILLVDEVLAVGDESFQKKCLGRMGDVARQGRTVLFVSHNLEAISFMTQKCLLLEHGSLAAAADTPSVVSAYLDLLRVPLSALNARNRVGEGPIRFASFHCEAEPGIPAAHLRSGQAVRIVLGYEAFPAQECQVAEVSVVVYTAGGTRLTNLSNYYFGEHPFERVPPRGQFVCVIPKLPLRSGDYWVDLYCRVGACVSDQIASAATFRVIDGDYYETGRVTRYSTGAIFCDQAWELRAGGAT